jgi:hypothetical protein
VKHAESQLLHVVRERVDKQRFEDLEVRSLRKPVEPEFLAKLGELLWSWPPVLARYPCVDRALGADRDNGRAEDAERGEPPPG